MAALSLSEIRAYVRDLMDLDDEDLPDHILDGFVREVFDDLASSDESWSFYEFDETFLTVPGQQAYDLETDIAGVRVEAINDVRSDTQQLRARDHRQMRSLFRAEGAGAARPTMYSRWGNHLYLWPSPDSEIPISVTGYRRPNEWVSGGAGAVPDLPDDFHYSIALGAVSLAYAQQEDTELAAAYGQRHEQRLQRLRKPFTRGLDAQPLVLNRPRGKDIFHREGLGPLFYDWE